MIKSREPKYVCLLSWKMIIIPQALSREGKKQKTTHWKEKLIWLWIKFQPKNYEIFFFSSVFSTKTWGNSSVQIISQGVTDWWFIEIMFVGIILKHAFVCECMYIYTHTHTISLSPPSSVTVTQL